MATRCTVVIVALLVLSAVPPAVAQPPSAIVTGVTNTQWPTGISDVAAFGQLVEQRQASLESTGINSTDVLLESTDIMVYSGVSTAAGLSRVKPDIVTLTQSNTPNLTMLTPRIATQEPIVKASCLSGTGYAVGYEAGGKISQMLARSADKVTLFADQNTAVAALENAIAAGTPVEVDVDFFYIFDEAAIAEPGLLTNSTKQHVSHFIVVTGYDANNVTFTDNGAAAFLGASGENVTVSWTSFLSAWGSVGLQTEGFPVWGPFFMLTVTSGPMPADPAFALAKLGFGSVHTPSTLRAAARIAANAKSDRRLDALLSRAALFAATRSAVAEFAGANGFADFSTEYSQSSASWLTLVDNENPATNASTLNSIANSEADQLGEMRNLLPGVQRIELVTPPNGLMSTDVTPIIFHWRVAPEVGDTVLQVSGSGDFSDESTRLRVAPQGNSSVAVVTTAQLMQILSASSPNRTMSWRVRGVGRNRGIVSEVRTFTIGTLGTTLISPADGFVATEDSQPVFVWQTSVAATSPRVIISTDSTFTNPADQITLIPVQGQESVQLPVSEETTLDPTDTDVTVYWKVVDLDKSVTGVQDSAVGNLVLP